MREHISIIFADTDEFRWIYSIGIKPLYICHILGKPVLY